MRSGFAVVATAIVAATVIVGSRPDGASAQAGRQALVGTFRLTAGSCDGERVAGSTFRMVVPSGSASGPYVSNNDSPCADRSYTPLAPGTDGGLVTGSHQSEPSPA